MKHAKPPRIVWTRQLQFAAIQDGWAIVRRAPADQRARLVNYIDYRNPEIARFKTMVDAIAHVRAQASTNHLHATALKFMDQQNTVLPNQKLTRYATLRTDQSRGAWEPACGRDGDALKRFFHLMVTERREKKRSGDRIPEHQRPMRPPPVITWAEWDQRSAAREGWVLFMSPTELRVMPRATNKGVFATDADAEAHVERMAFDAIDPTNSLHCRALDFRDRWLAFGKRAAERAHWGRNAKKRGEIVLGPRMLANPALASAVVETDH
jgi:hypothetical protein